MDENLIMNSNQPQVSFNHRSKLYVIFLLLFLLALVVAIIVLFDSNKTLESNFDAKLQDISGKLQDISGKIFQLDKLKLNYANVSKLVTISGSHMTKEFVCCASSAVAIEFDADFVSGPGIQDETNSIHKNCCFYEGMSYPEESVLNLICNCLFLTYT